MPQWARLSPSLKVKRWKTSSYSALSILNQKHHDDLSELFVFSVQKTALTALMNQNIPDKEGASLNISGENS